MQETQETTLDTYLLIGEYKVNCATCEIVKDGEVIKLQPKVMKVLELFLKHPGEVLTREKIESVVWADTVVGYDALTRAIAQLRRAFNDQNDNPWFIKTIPKKGYCLIATVDKTAADCNVECDSVQEPVQPETESSQNESVQSRSDSIAIRVAPIMLISLLCVTLIAYFLLWQDDEIDVPISADLIVDQAENLTKITVLPFESLSSVQENRYVAQGITSELITDISHLPGILVVSNNHTPELSTASDQELERDSLSADYFISGSVFKLGDQTHITVNLTDSKTTEYLWSDRYDVSTLDYYSLRKNITENVVETLSLHISKQEQVRLINRYTDYDQAFDLFLQARALMHSQNEKNSEAAKKLYQQCIDIDPAFGRAYSGLALSYAADYRYSRGDTPEAALGKAAELAKVGVSLNPELSETWEVTAYISLQRKDIDSAVDAIKEALKRNSNSADSYAILAGAQINTGHPEKGLEMIGRALTLKPEGGYHFYLLLGRAYYALGHYQQALSAFIRARDFNPQNLDSLVYLYACYQKTNNREEAAWIKNELLTIKPDFKLENWLEAHPLAHRESKQNLKQDLIRLTLSDTDKL